MDAIFSRSGALQLQPTETVTEQHGKDIVTVDLYQTPDGFLYAIRAKIGSRAWAKSPHKTDKPLADSLTAKRAAKTDLAAWCKENKLQKKFLQFEILRYTQLELF